MGDQLESILLECNVEPATASEIVASGWTPETLAICASSPDDFESHLDDIAPGIALNFQQKACLKLAWHKCQYPLQQKPQSQSSDLVQDQLAQFVDGSWSELFPAKISHAIMTDLKGKFAKHYPSEILSYETMPSTRLISQAYHNKQKGDHRWIPWKFRLSYQHATQPGVGSNSASSKKGASFSAEFTDSWRPIELFRSFFSTAFIL